MKRFLWTTLLTAGLAIPSATPAWAQRSAGAHASGGHARAAGRAPSSGHARSAGPRVSTGPAIGRAVPRGRVPTTAPYRPYRGVRGYYAPYFYGPAFGLGYGVYDPLWYDGYLGYGYPAYGVAPYVVPLGEVSGGLRIEVKPDTAQVFVDGAYAGIVDDFDGHFQHLDLTPGAHRIEIRAPGYEPLVFDTAIQPNHTTHYKGQMTPANGAVD